MCSTAQRDQLAQRSICVNGSLYNGTEHSPGQSVTHKARHQDSTNHMPASANRHQSPLKTMQ